MTGLVGRYAGLLGVQVKASAVTSMQYRIDFLIEGAMTPDYDPLRHPVSSLALGPFGWTQTLNFIFVGILTLAFAVGLVRLRGARHKVGGILVGVWGVGLIGAGAFVTDPVSGYPPGTPPTQVDTTTPGTLHDLFSVAAFFALVPHVSSSLVAEAGAGRCTPC